MSFDLNYLRNTKKERLQQLVDDTKKTGGNDNVWKLETDADGNGVAIIRFLPTPIVDVKKDADKARPFVKTVSYFYKSPEGKYYSELSPKTLGSSERDPVAEHKSVLWNSGSAEDKERQKAFQRDEKYWSNILVIKDTKNPSNEGKVFLFKYGKKIKAKIDAYTHPDTEIEGRDAEDIFDFDEGRDFVLRQKKVSGFPNYDDSAFKDKRKLADSDEKLMEIWESCHSLLSIVDPSNIKSYDELNEKFQKVLNSSGTGSASISDALQRKTQAKAETALGDLPSIDDDAIDDVDAFINSL